MKNVLCFIGAALYSVVASYLIWLAFYYLVPWVLSWGWIGVIAYLLVSTTVLGILFGMATLITAPLIAMCRNKACTVIPLIVFVIHGYCTAALPWHCNIHGARQTILAVYISFEVVALFLRLIWVIWSMRRVHEEESV